ncbi:hypothetical protein [Nocardiopsis rhodophaea]|uniref:hypothetical protein n=1 Tax=Nocardiopsis rhodophaea TaxID=280238 RepID=UPI0031CE1512
MSRGSARLSGGRAAARFAVGLAGVAVLSGALAFPAEAGRTEPRDEVEQQEQGTEGQDQPDQGEPDNPDNEVDRSELPALSVGVRDSLHWMGPGDESQYVITLRNDGDEPFERMLLFQSLMPEMELVDAGEEATTWDGAVAWEVSLAPGEEIVRTTSVRLGDVDEEARYIGTTACVQLEQGGPLVACGTDANLVPREEPQNQADHSDRSESSEEAGWSLGAAALEGWPPKWSLVGAGVGAVIGLGVVFFLWRRRVRRAARHIPKRGRHA